MTKISNRSKILSEGMKVVHQYGFGGASVRDIIQAAGVPQGSFTNHFASKEAFGLEILDIYFVQTLALHQQTLRNDALPPLARLRDFIQANRCRVEQDGMENGCLFSNFSGEAIAHSEIIRLRLTAIFAEIRGAIGYCLDAAVAAGELPASVDAAGMAEFILGALQGALMQAKVQRDPAPVERFEQILFGTLLAQLPRRPARAGHGVAA